MHLSFLYSGWIWVPLSQPVCHQWPTTVLCPSLRIRRESTNARLPISGELSLGTTLYLYLVQVRLHAWLDLLFTSLFLSIIISFYTAPFALIPIKSGSVFTRTMTRTHTTQELQAQLQVRQCIICGSLGIVMTTNYFLCVWAASIHFLPHTKYYRQWQFTDWQQCY